MTKIKKKRVLMKLFFLRNVLNVVLRWFGEKTRENGFVQHVNELLVYEKL